MIILDEASKILNISVNDLKTLCDLNILKHQNYMISEEELERYKNRKRDERNKYIPICDIEMLKNDKYEG